jgi:hypothetical protein
LHDAAIAAWSIKGWYDSIRPISVIRWMAQQGQSSDPQLPHYSPLGLPLIPGYIELVQPGDPWALSHSENLYKIKAMAWQAADSVSSPASDTAGVGWVLAERWWPYQRQTFVTPPFAGYVSGHSTYSRAAAEVLTAFTGDEYFPGGMGEFDAPRNQFLVFEDGPSVDVRCNGPRIATPPTSAASRGFGAGSTRQSTTSRAAGSAKSSASRRSRWPRNTSIAGDSTHRLQEPRRSTVRIGARRRV